MLFINKLFNSIACLLSFTNLQLVIPGRTWILLYLGRTVYKRLWACLALYISFHAFLCNLDVSVCMMTQTSVHAGIHPLGRNPPGQTPTPADGNCCGQYASYWNAFLYSDVLYKQRPFNAANHQLGK